MSSIPAVTAPAVQQAFEELAKSVLSGAAASISFSGLDTSNKMFRLTAYMVKDGTPGSPAVRFNNDAGANYDRQRILGNAGAVTAARAPNQSACHFFASADMGANQHGTLELVVGKELATEEAMVVASHATVPTNIEEVEYAWIWNNTAALISRIDLISNGGSWAADTAALLEGNSTT